MTIKDDDVWVSQKEFDELLEYSTTIPTGTTIGKRWKRKEPWNAPPGQGTWYMGTYIGHPDPDRVTIKWRKLHIGPYQQLDWQI